jgi:N-acetyl-gamma-glutamyl-phosphate reductase
VDISGFAFVPHLLPISRGLLVTCYARSKEHGRATEALRAAYSETSFVRVTEPEDVSIHSVAGTNFAHVGVAERGDTVVVLLAIDNLLKGAAGQAVQNMNLALGLDETTGLRSLARIAP